MCGAFEQPLISRVQATDAPQADEKNAVRATCKVIKIDKQTPAVFTLKPDFFTLKRSSLTKTYKYSSITHILLRCPLHKTTTVEIIFEAGKTLLIDFAPQQSLDTIQKLSKLAPNALAQTTASFFSFFRKTNSTQMWLDGQLTNFEYLMRVNMLCGRSFRHPALYPIFPWVILDFGSERADFGQEEMMRDLSYPITAQTPMQRKTLEEKVCEGECMYFTLPSNPTQVGHWLLRLEPFTALHIDNEGGHFGCDSRLFTSMAKTTVQVLESQNCWEPMPEFYYLLEFLLDLNGIGISPVQLPAWSCDAVEFVYQQRKALESDFVSRHLNKWIDLIFGIYLKNDTTSHFNSYSYMLHDDIWQVPIREVERAAETELIEVTLSKSGHLSPVVVDRLLREAADRALRLRVSRLAPRLRRRL